MNYLSHHHLARRAAGEDAPPAFYAGNLLPDLLAASGDGRLRRAHLAGAPDPDLRRGLALHLAADRRFHGAPEFARAQAEASTLLRGAPFGSPPRRVFFLAHVFVELALDGALVRADPTLADHLYDRLEAADLGTVAASAEAMLGRPLPRLRGALDRFVQGRYLLGYADDAGLAEALHHISRRAELDGFPPADRIVLADQFARFAPAAAQIGPALWQLPEGPTWYNTDEI